MTWEVKSTLWGGGSTGDTFQARRGFPVLQFVTGGGGELSLHGHTVDCDVFRSHPKRFYRTGRNRKKHLGGQEIYGCDGITAVSGHAPGELNTAEGHSARLASVELAFLILKLSRRS